MDPKEKKQGHVHSFLASLTRMLRNITGRISKLFDRVIYNDKLSLIASLVMALVICLSINYQDLSFRLFNKDAVTLNLAAIPVEVLVDDNTYEVSGLPITADITVEGDAADIQLVRTQNSASVTADLRSLSEGSNMVSLDAAGLPTGVNVRVNPSTVQVTLAKKYTKTFFITPDLIVGTGQSINAYNKPTLSSRSVTVRATRDKLNAIRAIRAIVDTSGNEGGFVAEVPLVAYDSQGKQVNVSINPPTVTATVTLVNSSSSTNSALSEQASQQEAQRKASEAKAQASQTLDDNENAG